MGANKKTTINMFCSLMVLFTNIIISFWLSPYIVEHIGVEANGFVTLANNFVSYATLLVTALNSMAARFITIEYVNKDYKKANLYYNSVFWGNLIIVLVLLIPAVYLIVRLENIVNVPSNIVIDVKILFSFVFFNFFIGTALPNWECGTFISNRLDKDYIPQMFTSVLRCLLIFGMMTLLVPRVWYVGLTSTVITVIMLFVRARNTHQFTPHLKVFLAKNKIICSWSAIKELVGSGIWNSISSVGTMLLNGLDLIICNLFIDAEAMGILAIAKILPHYIGLMGSSIRNAFAPEIVSNYAKGDMDKLQKDIKRAMKLTSVILTVPVGGIIVMAEDFYRLWVPSQDAHLLASLSIIVCLAYTYASGIQVLHIVFSAVNRVKTNALLMILSGVVSTVIVFILLNTTDLGIYAVAGVSVGVNFVRNMLYNIPYSAKYLGFKKTSFYPQVFTCVASSAILTIVGTVLHRFVTINNWFDFMLFTAFISVLFLFINYFIFLNKEERTLVLNKVKNKLIRK